MEIKRGRGRPKKAEEDKVVSYTVTATPKQRQIWEKKAARSKLEPTAFALKMMGL